MGNESEPKKEPRELSVYVKVGLTVFITFVCCILFFFMILRYEGFASGWNKLMGAISPITIGLVLAYLLTPVMRFCEKGVLPFFEKHSKNKVKAKKGQEQYRLPAVLSFYCSWLHYSLPLLFLP